jgi:uncharacterized protein DUF262
MQESKEPGVADITEAEDDEASVELRYSITSYGADYPVDSLVRRMREDSIFVPDFQRAFVWNLAEASRFVESLLLGLPVPGIFLAKEQDTNRMFVVDGQQRLRTLRSFYDGAFGSRVFALKGVSPRYEGKRHADLSPEDQRRLDDSIIHATIVRQDEPEDDDSSIYMIFERLNTEGSQLTPQEIRSTVSRGPFNELLDKLNSDTSWREVYGPLSPRKKDQELILRFLMLYFDQARYRRPMKEALNGFMYRNRRLGEVSEVEASDIFQRTIRLVRSSIGITAFRPTRALNAAVFDAVMVGLARRLSTDGEPSSEKVSAAYSRLLPFEDFVKAYDRSASEEEQVARRIDLATRAFAGT